MYGVTLVEYKISSILSNLHSFQCLAMIVKVGIIIEFRISYFSAWGVQFKCHFLQYETIWAMALPCSG